MPGCSSRAVSDVISRARVGNRLPSRMRSFSLQNPIEKKKPSEYGYDNLFEVTDQTPLQVQASIEKVAAEAIDEVLEGNGLRYALAQRGTGGQTQYVKELDRNYLEYRKMMREFSDASQVKKTTMMTRLMQVCAHTHVHMWCWGVCFCLKRAPAVCVFVWAQHIHKHTTGDVVSASAVLHFPKTPRFLPTPPTCGPPPVSTVSSCFQPLRGEISERCK